MRPTRLALVGFVVVLGLGSWAGPVEAQEGMYKVEVLKEAPPAGLPPEIKGAVQETGYRVVGEDGKPYVEFWLRKKAPASGKPSGPKGNLLFPVLAEGELLGVLRFPGEGFDFRDQSIAAGLYTVRYGIQPTDGAHLGASPYRDFALLIPAAQDKTLKDLPKKQLQESSAKSAGTSHPAVLMLLAPPDGTTASASAPTLAHDETKNTWGVVVGLPLDLGGGKSDTLNMQLIVVGKADA